MITGNKGEWSEIYAFFKLLSNGKLHAADENLEKIKDIYYPIINILKENGLEYKRNSSIKIIDGETGNEIMSLPVDEFTNASKQLLARIKEDKKKNGTFSFKEIEGFLEKIKIRSIKSPSKKKEDITLIVHDFRTGLKPKLAFSIKSMLGSASTLLNASKSTNFIYKLITNRLSVREEEVPYGTDTKMRIRDALVQKLNEDYKIIFSEIPNKTFKSNLQMIDSMLPDLLAWVVFYYYTTNNNSLVDLTKLLEKNNPLGYDKDVAHKFYRHKIKNFLLDVALGMTPSTPWKGKYDATGGYLIVKSDGDIVCYHIYNINEFKEYLFKNTKLDTPSTSRHDFGKIYAGDSTLEVKLNLQIRFIK